ncbi:iron-enterobactin ABC transporter permease [Pseudomonas sp. Marseille-Q5115]|uniref:iron-enterobactin ABC transporter permease n=1 Tax=Pseudomonas sp. Marseille-Q5115 TaxID=2866593 RepID=UPI001CE43AC3|nr:iron-enterobactin ABC transporter permease [Pseudomonas sp. Marseille-Q5115]
MSRVTQRRRVQGCALALMAACLWLGVYSLGKGTLPLSPEQLLNALLGQGPKGTRMIVMEWRLPRVVVALCLGAALGVSGAIFQSLLRNPLGSPDILGFNLGAYTGVLVWVVMFEGGMLASTGAALAGGLVTALLVYQLAWTSSMSALRLIVIGLGMRAFLLAVNNWLVTNTTLDTAVSAGLWNAGSLNGVTWAKALPALLIIAGALAAALLLSRRMRLLEMGDDTACALGVPVERSRLWLMLAGIVLTAATTAVAGPIAFVALAAPQIARRLGSGQALTLSMAALCGAFLLLSADVAAQHLLSPYQVPVGLITVSVGGLYLIALLIREARK